VAAPINDESRTELVDAWPCPLGDLILKTLAELRGLARTHEIGLLVGGRYNGKWQIARQEDGKTYPRPADSRNTTYLFQPDGSFGQGIGERYDKMHLVPFGEFIPMQHTFLHALFLKLGPDYYDEYQLEDGSDNGLTVFKLKDADGRPKWRFVTPICFEDIDGSLCARMFRPDADGKKRADFIVNVTNDGWFAANENSQHFQAAIFRSIENRVPTARSVAQGISGFVDSDGRPINCLPARTEGTSLMQLQLDSRLSLYTRFGDVFAWMCLTAAAVIAGAGLWKRTIKRGS
jgi:apolipoprotein N-acyltransferase